MRVYWWLCYELCADDLSNLHFQHTQNHLTLMPWYSELISSPVFAIISTLSMFERDWTTDDTSNLCQLSKLIILSNGAFHFYVVFVWLCSNPGTVYRFVRWLVCSSGPTIFPLFLRQFGLVNLNWSIRLRTITINVNYSERNLISRKLRMFTGPFLSRHVVFLSSVIMT